MRHPVIGLVLLLPLISGCLGDSGGQDAAEFEDTCGPRPRETFYGGDHSKETIGFQFATDGAFVVRVPVVLSPDGITTQQWAQSATGSATAQAVDTARGPALEVAADDGARVVVCTVLGASQRGNGCCAERYLDGTWSTTPGEVRPQAVHVEVAHGTVDVSIEYHAESNWCGRDASFHATGLGPGWHEVAGSDEAWCE